MLIWYANLPEETVYFLRRARERLAAVPPAAARAEVRRAVPPAGAARRQAQPDGARPGVGADPLRAVLGAVPDGRAGGRARRARPPTRTCRSSSSRRRSGFLGLFTLVFGWVLGAARRRAAEGPGARGVPATTIRSRGDCGCSEPGSLGDQVRSSASSSSAWSWRGSRRRVRSPVGAGRARQLRRRTPSRRRRAADDAARRHARRRDRRPGRRPDHARRSRRGRPSPSRRSRVPRPLPSASGGAPVAARGGRVSFEMTMPMGDHRYSLVPRADGWQEAEVVLPLCPSGKRRWFATVEGTRRRAAADGPLPARPGAARPAHASP